jgi:hypothetical protein
MSQEFPGTPKPSDPNASIGDAINYVGSNPGVVGTIIAGVKEIVTIIMLIFKPGIKSPR